MHEDQLNDRVAGLSVYTVLVSRSSFARLSVKNFIPSLLYLNGNSSCSKLQTKESD